MAKKHIELRRKRYFKLSSQIAQDNTQLRSLFDNSESNESSTGWGMNHSIIFGESKVFVKRVPVTNNNKDTKLRHAELRLLLKETGFLTAARTHGG
ncbi:hypothetical protein [Nostoc sp.]|uniref:hypothetical protein n=1 Tax=Nostoc sp. TaxID=1180 RepID=UPI002FF6FCEF